MEPLKTLRDLWDRYVRPVVNPPPRLNLFGHRYNLMQEAYAALGPVAQERIAFFIAAATDDEPLRDYLDYIDHLERFCQAADATPALSRGIDAQRLAHFAQRITLLQGAIRESDPAYLARVRTEMAVPDLSAAQARVRRAEIQMLKEDIQSYAGADGEAGASGPTSPRGESQSPPGPGA